MHLSAFRLLPSSHPPTCLPDPPVSPGQGVDRVAPIPAPSPPAGGQPDTQGRYFTNVDSISQEMRVSKCSDGLQAPCLPCPQPWSLILRAPPTGGSQGWGGGPWTQPRRSGKAPAPPRAPCVSEASAWPEMGPPVPSPRADGPPARGQCLNTHHPSLGLCPTLGSHPSLSWAPSRHKPDHITLTSLQALHWLPQTITLRPIWCFPDWVPRNPRVPGGHMCSADTFLGNAGFYYFCVCGVWGGGV